MDIPKYYHHPDDKHRPPEIYRFIFAGKEYCRFRAGNISVSFPKSLDVLMEDGRVIVEGDYVKGPIQTDSGVVVLVQDGPYTHILHNGISVVRERTGLDRIDDIAAEGNHISYRIGSRKSMISLDADLDRK